MLRRVLVPFSELFILISLMFLVLFFISAAMGGRGTSRPTDTLHLVEINWSIEPPFPVTINYEFGDIWLLKDGPFSAAATVEGDARKGRWLFTWGSPYSLRVVDWYSYSSIDRCYSVDLSNDRYDSDQWRREIIANLTPAPENRPPAAIKALTGRPETLITANTSTSKSVIKELDDQMALLALSTKLSLAFRPQDIARPIVIEAGLVGEAQNLGDGQPPNIGSGSISLSYSKADATQKEVSSIAFVSSNSATWSDSRRGGQAEAGPIYYALPGCPQGPYDPKSLRLFITISADGATATPYDPRIKS